MMDFALEEDRVDSTTRVYKPSVLDPYEDQTPINIMSREYLISTGTLANSGAPTFDLHQLLYAKMPASVLNLFRYMRYDGIEVRFVFTVDPQTYGMVALSWQPFLTASNYSVMNKYQLSQCNMQYIHVSESSELVYHVPYEATQDFLQHTESTYYLSNVCLWALTNLFAVGGGTVSLDYSVYARYVNPKMAGFVAQSYVNLACAAGEVLSSAMKSSAPLASTILGSLVSNVCKESSGSKGRPVTTEGEVIKGQESVVPTSIKNLVYGDWNQPKFIPDSIFLGAENHSFKPASGMFGPQLADVTINQLMQIPSLVTSSQFTSLTDVYQTKCLLENSAASATYGTYASYLSLMFMYWRGSVKIKLCFTGSPLVTTRLALTLSWSLTAPASVYLNNAPTRIVTVRGPTEIEFKIPFLYPYPWLPTVGKSGSTNVPYLGDLANNLYYPYLSVSVVNQQGPSSGFFAVPYTMFAAMAEDVEVRNLVYQCPEYTNTLKEETVPLKPLRGFIAQGILEDFSKSFDVLGTTSVSLTPREPGNVYTVRDLLSKWSRRSNSNLTYGPLWTPLSATQAQFYVNGLFDFLSSIFVFNRVSMKFRVEINNADEDQDLFVRMVTMAGSQSTTNPGKNFVPDSGYARINFKLNPLLEFEVPFRCLSEMTSNWNARCPQPMPFLIETDADTSPTLNGTSVCAGRDCEVSHLSFLPAVSTWPSS
jgi:hypothetical protein